MQNLKFKKAFSIIELIFVIVIIGVLSSIAIPKFRDVSSNAKISAEMAIASSVLSALEIINGEWSINEGDFKWGVNNQYTQNDLNIHGYPSELNSSIFDVLGKVVQGANGFKWHSSGDDTKISIFTGPASDPIDGVSPSEEKSNKPDKNDFWIFVHGINLDENCTISGTDINIKTLYEGNFALIDVDGTNPMIYGSILCN